ncbi:MAG: 30S ribosomal protein S24e [Candidatus Aenigmarchaeota archaeon]|nr:30S ribosomal protein S24e [Candidatus Aenigmarchaeota archaeon]NIP40715.1 30S ribosomal protein S24e [Candidatus Aenigmarchaeota archaeon]NIQ18521.1 30S ribosomal protein S24e [Candidatus Aenigmarchaeota archaeon]NIS73420.1 30S ribosomal protein S24e [Candidatus Aenigmarchaeota archaeon]
MVVKVIEEKKNPLLKREEVYCIFEHPDKATPSRKEMLPSLEKILKAKKDLIIIDKIFSVKGRGESKVHVFAYKKKEDIPKEKLEKMQRRMEKKEAKGKTIEEAKPEVAKEEAGKEPEEKPEEKGEKEEEPEKEEKPEGKG